MRTLAQDLREAARGLRKQPRFLIVASLTLALGIGAVTSIFSVVNGVLLTPLPHPQQERLVNIWSTAPGLGYDQFGLSPDIFFFYQRNNSVFDDMALHQAARVNLTESGPPEVLDALLTTSRFFSTLGTGFSRGRSYSADEDKPEAARVAVLSHRLWTRRYGGDPSLVGRPIRIDGNLTEVVGIAPAYMDHTGKVDIWLPARLDAADPPTATFSWQAIGRLKPGVRPDQATTHLEPLVARAMSEYIQSDNYRAFLKDGRYRPLVHSMKEDVVGSLREPLLILLGTVGMVLLVACGNVANLCLIRADARQRELAVRAALGASRAGLVRKLLVEALLLSAVGTSLGVLLSALALPLLLQLAPGTIPRLEAVTDQRHGAAGGGRRRDPVGADLRPGPGDPLHPGAGAHDAPPRRTRLDRSSVAAAGAAAARGRANRDGARAARRLGPARAKLCAADVGRPRLLGRERAHLPGRPSAIRVSETAPGRDRRDPDRGTAGAAPRHRDRRSHDRTAGNGQHLRQRIRVRRTDRRSRTPAAAGPLLERHPGLLRDPPYSAPARIADFDSGDMRDDARTALVNKSAAERYWPGQDAIGKRLRSFRSEDGWYVVKGIVADVQHEGLRQAPRPLVYYPVKVRDDNVPRGFSFVLRGPSATTQADAARRAVWTLNPDLPVASMRTMENVIEESVMQFTFTMLTLGIAAVIALVLGAVGLYGVQSYAVSLADAGDRRPHRAWGAAGAGAARGPGECSSGHRHRPGARPCRRGGADPLPERAALRDAAAGPGHVRRRCRPCCSRSVCSPRTFRREGQRRSARSRRCAGSDRALLADDAAQQRQVRQDHAGADGPPTSAGSRRRAPAGRFRRASRRSRLRSIAPPPVSTMPRS